MALTKEVREFIQVIDTGGIEIRRVTTILEDGVAIATTNHREAVAPGGDVSKHSDRVAAIAGLIWTPEVLQAHAARIAASDEAQQKPIER